jgi:hypothetical protein
VVSFPRSHRNSLHLINAFTSDVSVSRVASFDDLNREVLLFPHFLHRNLQRIEICLSSRALFFRFDNARVESIQVRLTCHSLAIHFGPLQIGESEDINSKRTSQYFKSNIYIYTTTDCTRTYINFTMELFDLHMIPVLYFTYVGEGD